MANVNNPNGFWPKVHARGGVIRPSTTPYQIAGALAANIYRGSPVIPVNTNRRITVAAAGNRLAGIFKGCTFWDANTGDVRYEPKWLSGQTIKTGTIAEATVFDDPDLLYSAQVSGTPGLAVGDIGNFADVVIGTGNAVTGNSGDMVDQATLGTTSGQVKIIDKDPMVGNDFGQYCRALVQINESYGGPDTTAGNSLTAI
jgi:hypothetical protein